MGAAQTAILSCDAPTGLHASDVGLDFITIAWDDDPNVSNWQVWFYPHGYGSASPNEGTVTDANTFTMPYTFIIYDDSPNHPGTSPLYYDFAVRADCGDSTWGPWSNVLTVATPYVGIEERLQKAVTLYPIPATSYVDVRVVVRDELTVRIRDNCPEFDPRKRLEVFYPESPEKNVGIRLTAGLARQMDYYNNAGINTLVLKM